MEAFPLREGFHKKTNYSAQIFTKTNKKMNWLIYLLQVNLYLILFYGFYRLLLRNETFHGLNRAYLVAVAGVSFFVPVLQSDWVRSWFVTEQVHQMVYSFYSPEMLIVRADPSIENSFTWGNLIAFFYLLGFIICLIRFGLRMNELVRFLKPKTRQRNPKMAFSFFNILFVGKHLTQQDTIVAHERVHIRQLHSADVMLFEIIGLFCWFNPVLLAYKKSIREIHEFMADHVASRHEASKAEYAMLLFSQQFGVIPSQLTNHFFDESMLKLRIKMLMKPRSPKTALYKYGFIAPLFGLMIMLSSATLVKKPLAKIEAVIEKITETPVEIKPTKTAKEVLAEAGIDLSKALIISPALREEMNRDTTKVFLENMTEFKGGMAGLGKYLTANLKYPEAASKAKVQGKVYVQFTVNIDGKTSNVKVAKGIGFGCDEEAMRVIKNSVWTPRIRQGKKVISGITLPIAFLLDGEPPLGSPDKTTRMIDGFIHTAQFDGIVQSDYVPNKVSILVYKLKENEKLDATLKTKIPYTIDSKPFIYPQDKDEIEAFLKKNVPNPANYRFSVVNQEFVVEAFTRNIAHVLDNKYSDADYNFLGKHLQKNLRYPKEANDNNTQGSVCVGFISDGEQLSDFKVLKNDPNVTVFGDEVIRVLKNSPKMPQGSYVLPVLFIIENEKVKPFLSYPTPAAVGRKTLGEIVVASYGKK